MQEIQNEPLKEQLISEYEFKQKFTTDVIKHTLLFHFLPGEFIVCEGRQPAYVFYLVRGRTKLFVTLANGRISLVDFFSAPCFIGEIEMLDETHESRAVQAIEECWCLALPAKQCRTLLQNDVLFLRHTCLGLVKKNYRNIVTSTRNQAFPLINRLAAFILLTQHEGIYRERHTQVADYLGVTYRHLLYLFAQFCAEEILTKQQGGYAITGRSALVKLAQQMEPNRHF